MRHVDGIEPEPQPDPGPDAEPEPTLPLDAVRRIVDRLEHVIVMAEAAGEHDVAECLKVALAEAKRIVTAH